MKSPKEYLLIDPKVCISLAALANNVANLHDSSLSKAMIGILAVYLGDIATVNGRDGNYPFTGVQMATLAKCLTSMCLDIDWPKDAEASNCGLHACLLNAQSSLINCYSSKIALPWTPIVECLLSKSCEHPLIDVWRIVEVNKPAFRSDPQTPGLTDFLHPLFERVIAGIQKLAEEDIKELNDLLEPTIGKASSAAYGNNLLNLLTLLIRARRWLLPESEARLMQLGQSISTKLVAAIGKSAHHFCKPQEVRSSYVALESFLKTSVAARVLRRYLDLGFYSDDEQTIAAASAVCRDLLAAAHKLKQPLPDFIVNLPV